MGAVDRHALGLKLSLLPRKIRGFLSSRHVGIDAIPQQAGPPSKFHRESPALPGTIAKVPRLPLQLGTNRREGSMRRVLFSTISLLALTATAVVAADIPRPVARAPVYVPLAYNWTGFYLGINGGYGWGRSSWDA